MTGDTEAIRAEEAKAEVLWLVEWTQKAWKGLLEQGR